MSQNDFTIANQGFPAFRADLNSALQALASNSSGATAPSTTFANMWWYDSANNIMYIRNEDNDAWIKFAELDQTNDKFVLSGTLQLDDGTVSAPALTFNSDTNMGIYRGGTDILKFVTAGTDAITIDASQNTTFAGTVTAGAVAVDNITIDATEIDSTSALTLDSAGTISLDADSGSINLLDGGVTHAELINSSNDFIIKSSQSDKDIIFKGVDGISLIEAMRIDMSEGGNVGIGKSVPLSKLDVTGGFITVSKDANSAGRIGASEYITGSTDNDLVIQATGSGATKFYQSGVNSLNIISDGALCINRTNQANNERFAITGNTGEQCMSLTSPITTPYDMINIINGNGQVGSILTSGTSTSYNTSSDHRLKENVTADWDATTRLKQLNPVRFNFIADADTTVDGFLAHEVQSVVPEAITGTHNEVDADGNPIYQGIDQSKLVPLLVKTIQELEARIVALETA